MRRIAEDNLEASRIMLGLLDAVEQDRAHSQRHLASELGIALGLVNAYLKRCMNKGLVKMRAVPTRRYAYYLTPKGFAEKSRLTVDYFSSSFSFFRRARADCSATLKTATGRGCRTVALLGTSDLAEIAIICAMETGMTVSAVVDPTSNETRFVGIPVVPSLELILDQVDAVVVTDLKSAQAIADAAVEAFGGNNVLAPALLNVRIGQENGAGR